ncbi:hypothetical protein ACEPAI_5748 [Sanghuangporus weigelae]
MSRFTRPPFHKPSPFDIPRPVNPHPPSPPETEITADSVPLPPMSIVSRDLHAYTDIGASSSFTRVDAPEMYYHSTAVLESQTQASTPNMNGRFRRPSNLSYLHPGSLRNDLRAAPRSATRWLVMVIPPTAVAREHGNGTFLSASLQTSQGVLLPLLPSLSGQLTAIAREFAFPSTTGICIYLQMSEGGVQFAPRISDESWSILWASAFDERQSLHTMGGLPIAGRIEFDLDLRKARWFDMWLSSVRNSVDIGMGSVASASVPASLAANTNHRREDSRTTNFDHTEESFGVGDDVSVTIQRKTPVVRHVPRKLSLLDRIDVSSIKPLAMPRPVSRIALSPTDAEQPRLVLSPVAQTPISIPVPVTIAVEGDEPQTATQRRSDVEKKVENWRASSTFAKSPLVASTGQVSLDPANMPNNQPLVESDVVAANEPLNLDDFTWSISSAGPLSADYVDPIPPYAEISRPPSVHLDARLEGSVCLTPTTCTSFGPPDYDPFSPVVSLVDRLPSPDIAARQLEDVPPTPTTATSWGPPSEWPGSPVSEMRAPSVDIAMRGLGSRPVTPTTATSWGPPSEWPGSPARYSRAPSVDLAMRQLGSRPVTPSTATSWGAPLEWPRSPATSFYLPTPGVGNMFFDGHDEERALLEPRRNLRSINAGDKEPHLMVLMNDDAIPKSRPWKFVWPYTESSDSDTQESISVCIQSVYPCISLYPAVYPHFDLYPAVAVPVKTARQPSHRRDLRAHTGVTVERTAKPLNHDRPYQKVEDVTSPIEVRLPSVYPSLDLYPAVYPHFDLYPVKLVAVGTTREIDVHLEPRYPTFSIYPAVYPTFEIYPGHAVEPQRNQEGISIHLEPAYPYLRPYPPVYPYFDLYPASLVVKTSGDRSPPQKRALPSNSGTLQKRKASPWKHVWPYQQVEDVTRPMNVRLEAVYPSFNLYPAVYPNFELYPASYSVKSTAVVKIAPVVRTRSERPLPQPHSVPKSDVVRSQKVSTCRNVWPHQQVYQQAEGVTHPENVSLPAVYPRFDIYPACYPHFDLYPEGPVVHGQTKEVDVKLGAKYPKFSIYPAIYPDFEIYTGHVEEAQKNLYDLLKVKLAGSTYPNFDIYPAVYPYFDIYRSGVASTPENWREACRVELGAKYPSMVIYPAVYPYFDIYRSGVASTPEYWREPCRVELAAKYPVMDIYAPVYPHFDIYRSGHISDSAPLSRTLSTKLEAKYPAFDIYVAVYPHFELYPSIQVGTVSPRRRLRKTHRELIDLVLSQSSKPAPTVQTRVVPRISISSHETRRRPRRTHKDLVEHVFPQNADEVTQPETRKESVAIPRVRKAADIPQDTPGEERARIRRTPSTGAARLSHIPIRPSEMRRSMSLGQATMSSSSGVSRSQSLRHLSSVREESTVARSYGGSASQLRRVAGSERKPTRDSIVLEKARLWGSPASKPISQIDNPSPVSMKDLSEFPMPPLPSVPGTNHVPGAAVSTGKMDRPVSKLDRTKFPFR